MGDTLVDLILARGLAESTFLTATITQAALNQVYTITVRPQRPFKHAIVTLIQVPIRMPDQSGKPIAIATTAAPSSTAYVTVATWTVATDREGMLREVSLDSDNFVNTDWRLTISGNEQFADYTPRVGLTLPFGDNLIPEGATVLLEANASSGTINAFGSIAGVEFPTHIFTVLARKAGNLSVLTGLTTRDLIQNGLSVWAYITETDPLHIDVVNINGVGNERFHATILALNTDALRLESIREMAENFGVHEMQGAPGNVLPSSFQGQGPVLAHPALQR